MLCCFKTGQCFKERSEINNSDKYAFFEGFGASVLREIIGMKKLLKCTPLLREFDKFIRASASGTRRKPDGTRITPGTLETYCNCRKILFSYSVRYGEPSVYTGLTVNARIFRERTRYWKQWLIHFTDHLHSCRYSESYIWNNLKILRTLMYYLRQQYGWPDAGFLVFKLPRVTQPEPLTLSAPQLQALMGQQFGGSYIESRLSYIRDLVVTGSLTALRYSDLMSIKWTNLVRSGGKTWLDLRSLKTGAHTRLLIPEILTTMLTRYRKLRRKTIFPRISNVNFNLQIKKLGLRMGWCEPIRIIRTRSGLHTERMAKFNELLTTHTMRRTGITLMLQLGMPEHVVRQISGHAPNSKEFYRYVSIAQNWQDQESERVYELLLGKPTC